MPQSAYNQFLSWIEQEKWDAVLSAENAHDKAEVLQNLLVNKVDQYFPQKWRKFKSDDKPWFTEKLKQIDRKKKREYKKNRKSQKYKLIKWKEDD